MEKALKLAILVSCIALFLGSTLCLAQTESQASGPLPLPKPGVGPVSDFDKVPAPSGSFVVPAEHWRERSSGYYIEYFDVNAGTILGWTVIPSNNRGYDKYGSVGSSFTASWSTQGSSRWASSGEVAYMSPYPFSSYTFTNAWGASGSGTMTTTTGTGGTLYESFFDGVMVGPSAIPFTDDGLGTFSMPYVSDPGNYVDNRVYDVMGDGSVNWRGTTYGYGYSNSIGFSFNADCRRLDDQTYSYGLQFFADSPMGPTSNGYGFWITSTSFSCWKTVGGVSTNVFPWTTSTEINGLGEWNNLRVETLNGNMEFFINDVSVGTAFDTDLNYGFIGVGAYDGVGDANVQWDNLTVHRQPSVLVGGANNTNPATSLWPATHSGL